MSLSMVVSPLRPAPWCAGYESSLIVTQKTGELNCLSAEAVAGYERRRAFLDGFIAAWTEEREEYRKGRQSKADFGEEVADDGINGAPRMPCDALDLGAAFEQRRAVGDFPGRIDDGADAGIGDADQRDFGFNRAHRRHREKLIGR